MYYRLVSEWQTQLHGQEQKGHIEVPEDQFCNLFANFDDTHCQIVSQ